MKQSTPIQCKGKYRLQLSRDNKVIQDVTIHNIFVWQYFSYWTGYQYDTERVLGYYLYIGSGSNAPTMNDKKLQSLMWIIAYSSYKQLSTSQDGLTRTWQMVYKVPANSSYQGTVRELGLSVYHYGDYSRYIGTRALVVDSEGNPIEIQKTYMDELTITVEVSITRPSWKTGFTWDFTGRAFGGSRILHPFGANSSTNGNVRCVLSYATGGIGVPANNSPATTSKSYLTWNNDNKTWSAGAEWAGNWTWGNLNRAFINSLMVSYISSSNSYHTDSGGYHILLPNADIFPVRTLENLSLGTGDGTTTDFTPILPAWMENTEKVYKNGIELVRGVDYLANHVHNVNRYISVELGAFAVDIINDVTEAPTTPYLWGAYKTMNSNVIKAGVKKDHPLIIEYATELAFTTKVNYFILGSWYANKDNPAVTALIFSYSTDGGNTYTEFGRITTRREKRYYENTQLQRMEEVSGITHVKIELDTTDTSVVLTALDVSGRFGYQGEYAIRFLTPPAEGDILTMDCNIDRPWKDENTIIQWNPILDFSGVGG